MSWFQIWTICWQLAVFLTPMMVGCAVLWLKSQFVTKVAFDAERNRVDGKLGADKIERDARYDVVREKTSDHETRIRMIEAEIIKPPTRHALNNEITKLLAAVQATDRGVGALGKQIDTVQEYIRTLIDKGLER